MTGPGEGPPRGTRPATEPPGGAGPEAGLAFTWHGQRLRALPHRALWWPDRGALVVADLHLGKEAHFRARGIPVPEGPGQADDLRVRSLLAGLGARSLVVLGDLVHGAPSWTPAVEAILKGWMSMAEVRVVTGNHDLRAGLQEAPEGLEWLPEGTMLGPFRLHHHPVAPDGGTPLLAGHLHPVVRLRGADGDGVRAPCFWIRQDAMVLPAFGSFTGGHPVRPGPGDRILVTGPSPRDGVVEVPTGR